MSLLIGGVTMLLFYTARYFLPFGKDASEPEDGEGSDDDPDPDSMRTVVAVGGGMVLCGLMVRILHHTMTQRISEVAHWHEGDVLSGMSSAVARDAAHAYHTAGTHAVKAYHVAREKAAEAYHVAGERAVDVYHAAGHHVRDAVAGAVDAAPGLIERGTGMARDAVAGVVDAAPGLVERGAGMARDLYATASSAAQGAVDRAAPQQHAG